MDPNGERGEAFVVWLDPGGGSECTGRVERVATSQRERFASAEELIALLLRARSERTARVTPRVGKEH